MGSISHRCCWAVLVPAGATTFGVILTSLLATAALGDSLHGQGPALDMMVERGAIFYGGEAQHNLSGNGVVLD